MATKSTSVGPRLAGRGRLITTLGVGFGIAVAIGNTIGAGTPGAERCPKRADKANGRSIPPGAATMSSDRAGSGPAQLVGRPSRHRVELAAAVAAVIDRRLASGRWRSGRELTIADAEWIAAIGERIRAELAGRD